MIKNFSIWNFLIVAILMISTLNLQAHHLSFIPTNTLNQCLFMEGKMKIVCTSQDYQIMIMDVLQNKITLTRTFQLSPQEFSLFRKLSVSQDLGRILLATDNEINLYAFEKEELFLRWNHDSGARFGYFRGIKDLRAIIIKEVGLDFQIFSNLPENQTTIQTNVFSSSLSRYSQNALSQDQNFYAFQESPTSLTLYQFHQATNGDVIPTEEASIQTEGKILNKRSAFSQEGQFYTYFNNGVINIYQRNNQIKEFEQIQTITLDPTENFKEIYASKQTLFIVAKDSVINEFVIKVFKINLNSKQFEANESVIFNETYDQISFRQRYTFLYTPTEAKLFYECPWGCVNCTAHLRCITCKEGLKLEGGRCRHFDECYEYFDDSFTVCQRFCDKKCKVCGKSVSQCLQCNELMSLNEGNCKETLGGKSYLALYLLFQTIRAPRWRSIYLLIDNLELYQYHKEEYSESLHQVLQIQHQINEMMESLLMSSQIEDKTKMQRLSQYNYFTNPSFLRIERKNELIFVNFIVSEAAQIILRVLAFILLAFLFMVLRKFQISRFLRIYSFKLYLLELIFCDNIACLVYLARINFGMFFRIQHSLVQVGSLYFCAFYSTFGFLITFSILYFYCSSYGKLVKYFYTNLYRIRGAFLYSFLRFFMKPMLLGLIHATFFKSQEVQLLALMGIEFISAALTIIFATKMQIFKIKTLLVNSLSYDFLMCLLNFLTYLKIGYRGEIAELAEKGVLICIFGLISGLLLEVSVFIIETIFTSPSYIKQEEGQGGQSISNVQKDGKVDQEIKEEKEKKEEKEEKKKKKASLESRKKSKAGKKVNKKRSRVNQRVFEIDLASLD